MGRNFGVEWNIFVKQLKLLSCNLISDIADSMVWPQLCACLALRQGAVHIDGSDCRQKTAYIKFTITEVISLVESE